MAAKRQRLESEDLYAKGHQWDEIELKFDDGQSIYVSKGFLSYMSPVFQGMFRSECKEVTNNCVELKGKDREVFKKILLRMDPRSGKSFKNADRYQVYTIAHEYQVKKICDECEKFFIKSMEDERNELMSGLDRFGALGKAFSMLDFAKNFSNDKIVFSAYELISAFPTRHIIQHPSFTVLSDADKVKVLKYRLARTDHPGIIEPIHLTVPSYFTDL